VLFGPLFQSGKFDRISLLHWLDQLFVLSKKLSPSIVLVVPPYHSLASAQEKVDLDKYDETFISKQFLPTKSHSVVLDNNLDEDLAWMKLKPEARRKVRRGKEMGFCVRKILCEADFLVYCKEKGKRIAKILLEDRRKICSLDENIDLYVVEKDERALAWQGVSWGEDVAILEGNCVSDYARENRLYGNHLLQWYVIQEAIRRGVRWIDWVGADPEPKTQKQKNITEFKLLWGGEIVTYNTYEYRFKNWRNSLFDFLKGCKDWKNRRFGGE